MLKLHVSTNLNSGGVLNIEADNVNELHGALTYMHSIGQLGAPQQAVAPEPPVSDEPIAETGEPNGETANADTAEKTPVVNTAPPAAVDKPARKPRQTKAEKEAAAAAAESAKDDAVTPETKVESAKGDAKQQPLVKATAEDAAAAITEVANVKGLAAAKALLTVFKVKRAGELDPSQFESFIKEATALIAPADEEATDEDPADIL